MDISFIPTETDQDHSLYIVYYIYIYWRMWWISGNQQKAYTIMHYCTNSLTFCVVTESRQYWARIIWKVDDLVKDVKYNLNTFSKLQLNGFTRVIESNPCILLLHYYPHPRTFSKWLFIILQPLFKIFYFPFIV